MREEHGKLRARGLGKLMLALGILLLAGGVLSAAFGILQNTVLYSLFASNNAQLALQWDGVKLESPGALCIIIGVVCIASGITLIALHKARKRGKP